MFEKVMLESIAHMLGLMAALPNLRSQPMSGDRAGAFTQWFDGGAIGIVTGYTVFEFTNGGQVLVPTAFPHILIQLASGERLSLSLEGARVGEVPPPAPPAVTAAVPVAVAPIAPPTVPVPVVEQPAPLITCQNCGHGNTAVARFCSECGTLLAPTTTLSGSVAAPVPPPLSPAPAADSGQPAAAPKVAQPAVTPPPVPAQIETIPPADKRCPHCSLDNKPGARFCRRCGQPLA